MINAKIIQCSTWMTIVHESLYCTYADQTLIIVERSFCCALDGDDLRYLDYKSWESKFELPLTNAKGDF